MSDIGVSNTGYTHIKDTIHGSNVLSSLLDTGVFPGSFRVIKGYVDFSVAANASVGDGKAVLSSFDGVQVLLATGDVVIHAVALADRTITSAGSPTFDVGFSVSPSTAVSSALFTASAMSAINTGAASITPLKISSNQWLSIDLNVAAVTAGRLEVLLVVV